MNISKFSFALFIIISTAYIAESLNILDKKYATIIMGAAAVIQLILLIALIAIIINGNRKICGIRMIRYKFNDRLVKGKDFILPKHISTTNPRKSAIFKILLEIKYEDEPPEIMISKTGVTVAPDRKDLFVNVDSIIEDNSFLFDADIIVKPGEKLNFQLGKDTIIKSFLLGEIYKP